MKEYRLIAVILTYISISLQERNVDILVTAPIGKYEGAILISRLGRKIFSFRGMRYAKAPVGNLRFQPPIPIDKFYNVYNATADGPLCPQLTDYPVSEDCLIINVYTTQLPTNSLNPKRPVIFYIHSGGFYSGTGASHRHGPQYFLDQDIVLVTINYRLASLGFLSTGTKEAPGNNGLKDQVMALKWVKQNIEAFGGDSNSVTLVGNSAGGWSIQLHMLSPISMGLFHKAVAMSGSGFGQIVIPNSQPDLAKKQARLLGCPEDTPENIINCLKMKPVSDFASTSRRFYEFMKDPIYIWYPVVENDFGQERFFSDNPTKLVKGGQFLNIPLIAGITKNEFDQRAINVYENRTLLKYFDENFEKLAPFIFMYERNTENSKHISKTLRKAFLGDGLLTNTSKRELGVLYTDAAMGFPINRGIKLFAQKNRQPVYYYHFVYQGRYSRHYITGTKTPIGIGHQDDLIYLLYTKERFPLFNETDPESQMVDKLTSIYANFARTGFPIPTQSKTSKNVTWESFNLQSQMYLEIGNDFQMKEKLNEERYSVWEKLFPI